MSDAIAMIFANGILPDLEAARALLTSGSLLIAADGGARHLGALGLRPDVLIGDLDSLSMEEVEAYRQQGVQIHQYKPEKDETDLELALLYAARTGCSRLRIVAGLGGRFDQSLANLFLLSLPELAHLDVRLDDGLEEVMLIRDEVTLTGQADDIVSLLPLGGPALGVVTSGLRYPLNAETLLPERSRGVSNEMAGREAKVSLTHGLLICIHTRTSKGFSG